MPEPFFARVDQRRQRAEVGDFMGRLQLATPEKDPSPSDLPGKKWLKPLKGLIDCITNGPVNDR